VPFRQLIESINLYLPLVTVAWVKREKTDTDGPHPRPDRLLLGHELRNRRTSIDLGRR
jgi:hypothetical protein